MGHQGAKEGKPETLSLWIVRQDLLGCWGATGIKQDHILEKTAGESIGIVEHSRVCTMQAGAAGIWWHLAKFWVRGERIIGWSCSA